MVTYQIEYKPSETSGWTTINNTVTKASHAVEWASRASLAPSSRVRIVGLSTELHPDGTIIRRELTPEELAAAIRGEQVEPKPVKSVIAVRDEDGREAIYVDGKLFRQMTLGEDDDLGICDMVDAANGSPVMIDLRWVDRPVQEWPKQFDDLQINN